MLLSLLKNLAFSKISLPAVPENVKVFRIAKSFCFFYARLVLEIFSQETTFLIYVYISMVLRFVHFAYMNSGCITPCR